MSGDAIRCHHCGWGVMKRLLAFVAASALGMCASSFSAKAAIQILTGSNAAVTENVLFSNNPPSALTVQGITDPASALVNFTGAETLIGNGGQAKLEAVDGAFSQVSWILNTPNTGYTDLQFNIDFPNPTGGSPDLGTITITVLNQFGVATVLSGAELASNGQNTFQAHAMGGDLITQVLLSGTQWTSLQQIRLGGIEPISAAAPELSTWAMMLLGFAGIGFLAYRRKKKASAAVSA
jgi:hypothetical protein